MFCMEKKFNFFNIVLDKFLVFFFFFKFLQLPMENWIAFAGSAFCSTLSFARAWVSFLD